MPRLLQARLGDQVADPAALARLAGFAAAAPPLEPEKLDQIAALPLGSRVKLNPWTNQLALVKTRPLALLSPREKMPFRGDALRAVSDAERSRQREEIAGGAPELLGYRPGDTLRSRISQILAGFPLQLRVQAVAVRVHGDDRHEVVYVQLPHGLGDAEFEQAHAQYLDRWSARNIAPRRRCR